MKKFLVAVREGYVRDVQVARVGYVGDDDDCELDWDDAFGELVVGVYKAEDKLKAQLLAMADGWDMSITTVYELA